MCRPPERPARARSTGLLWDYDEYVNVPLDAFVRTINRALDGGYSVAFDTDWGDPGAAWNEAGIAVIHPDMAPGYAMNQGTRQADFEEYRTTDDHLVHAVVHRVLEGWDWYLIQELPRHRSGETGVCLDAWGLAGAPGAERHDAPGRVGQRVARADPLGSALSGGPGLSEPLNPAGLLEAPRAR